MIGSPGGMSNGKAGVNGHVGGGLPAHNPDVCGLGWPGNCPGCIAEYPAWKATQARQRAEEEAAARRRKTRQRAEELARLIADHADLFGPLLVDLLEGRP
jgi:hypothetical protein